MAKKKTAPSVRNDRKLSPEELQKAIAVYKARRAAEANGDDEEGKAEKLAESEIVKPQKEVPAPAPVNKGEEKKDGEPEEKPQPQEAPELPDQSKPFDEKIAAVKNRRDLRDEEGDPEDMNGAMKQIAEQDEDIQYLYDIIDTLIAERDFGGNGGTGNADADTDPIPANNKAEAAAKPNLTDKDLAEAKADSEDEDEDEDEDDPEDLNEDGADCEDKANCDSDDDEEDPLDDEEFEEDEDEEEEEDEPAPFPAKDEDEEFEEDGDDDRIPSRLNQDSIDAIVQKQLRKRMEIAKIGARLNLDGLEYKSISVAKKKIIHKVRPEIRLDGKSDTYIDALYRLCVDDVKRATRKDTAFQRRQIFQKAYNADSKNANGREEGSAESRRAAMIEKENHRRSNGKDKK